MRRAVPLLLGTLLTGQAPVPLRLPNGVTARLQEDHEAPLIRVEGLLPIAPADVPPALPGLPALLLETLLQGPKGSRSASEFQGVAEGSAIRLSLRGEGRGWRLTLVCRSRDQELAFALLGDLLTRTIVDPTLLEAARLRLHREARDPLQTARAQWAAEVSGSAHMPASEGTLSRAGQADLEALQARLLRPERLRLELQGDLSPAQAQQLLLLALGAWHPASAPTPPPHPAPPQASQLVQPEAPGTLWLALAAPDPTDPEGALLGLLLPERLPGLQGAGIPGDPWRLRVSAAQPEAALKALEARLAALTFTEADLAGARRAWRGQRILEALDPGQTLAARLEGRPSEGALDQVSPASLGRALRGLAGPGARHLLWTGDAAWLKLVPAPE